MFYLICFFHKSFKPLIKSQIKQCDQKLNNWEELVQKIINTKAKASFLPPFILQKIDQYIIYSKQIVENNKTSHQKAFMKDFQVKELKPLTQKTRPTSPQYFKKIV